MTCPGVQAAQEVESILNGMRTDAVISPRWRRPFWQSGYDAGLRDAHEAVQSILDAHGIWHPMQAARS